jgi:hypothetical protein
MADEREVWTALAMALCRCAYLLPCNYLDPRDHAKRCPYTAARAILEPYELQPKARVEVTEHVAPF